MNISSSSPQESRPLGYWLKAVDRLMNAQFRAAFANEGISRREWRLLSIMDGSLSSDRPLHGPKLRRLADRGWVTRDGDGWTLTESGAAAKTRLAAIVDGIRAKATDAVDPDDLATTMATLEKLAVAYGWDAKTPLPRREHRFGGHGRHDRFDGRGRHDKFGGHDRRHGYDHGHGGHFAHSGCDGQSTHAGHYEYSSGYGRGYGHRHDRGYSHGHHDSHYGHASQGVATGYAPQHPHCDHAPERHGRHRGMPLKPHRGFGYGRG